MHTFYVTMGLKEICTAMISLLFFVFNFIVFLGAIACTFLIYRLQSFTETKQDGSSFLVINALIIIGGFVAVLTCLGCYGVATDNRFYLLLYVTMMVILIILQCTFGSYFLKKSAELKNDVFDSFKNLTKHDGKTPNKLLVPLDHPIHAIQRHANCCGVDAYKEWIEIIGYVPGSCCYKPTNNDSCQVSQMESKKSCRAIINQYFDYVPAVFYSAIFIYVIELVVTVWAITILVTMNRESNPSTYIVSVGPSGMKELAGNTELLDLDSAPTDIETDSKTEESAEFSEPVTKNTTSNSAV